MKTDFKLVRAIRVVCFQLLLAQIFIIQKNIKNNMNDPTGSQTLSFHTGTRAPTVQDTLVK